MLAALLGFLILTAGAAPAEAPGIQPYGDALFAKLAAEGRSIVLHFTSPSCPVCASQDAALERLAAEPGGHTPAFLRAAYSAGDKLAARHGVDAPSTVLLFRGERLLARSVGLLTEDDLSAFLRDARMRARARPASRPKRSYRVKR